MANLRVHPGPLRRALLVAALVFSPSSLIHAQPVLEDQAVERLRESTTYLAGLERFALQAEATIEFVLLTGQKIQVDDSSEALVKRPDRFYAARRAGDIDQEFFYDGKSLTLVDGAAGYHATVDAPGTLEGMLDFVRDSLDIVAPAGDFLYANAFDLLMQDVYSGFVVGTAIVHGLACDHLAFSAPGTDWQVWIQQGDKPLLRKLVITSRDVVNAPQFTVLIREWDLAPDVSDTRFRFEPDESSRQIEFITSGAATP